MGDGQLSAAAWVAAWFATLFLAWAAWCGRRAAADASNQGAGVGAAFLGFAGFVLAMLAIRHAAFPA